MIELKRTLEQPFPGDETPRHFPASEKEQGKTEKALEAPETHVRVDVAAERAQPTAHSQQRTARSTAPTVVQPVDPLVRDVETILADGLGELFSRMDPRQQEQFKVAGEHTAREISSMLRKAKFQAKKILTLIQKWLRLIPTVNAFFLEKEAQLRFERILALHDQLRER